MRQAMNYGVTLGRGRVIVVYDYVTADPAYPDAIKMIQFKINKDYIEPGTSIDPDTPIEYATEDAINIAFANNEAIDQLIEVLQDLKTMEPEA